MSTSTDPSKVEVQEAGLRKAIRKETQHLADIRSAIAQFVENVALVRENTDHFSDLITQLRNHLAKHFALKVKNGYMSEAAAEEPRLSGVIEHLRSQHAELFVMISDIADSAEELAQRAVSAEQLEDILARLRAFDLALASHEREESEVLYEATDVDLGGEG